MLLNQDAESIIKANDICDRYGIDTISAGTVLAFAMECYKHAFPQGLPTHPSWAHLVAGPSILML